jgi:hypothetical protein
MLIDPAELLHDFMSAAGWARVDGWPADVRTEVLRAPHRQGGLPAGVGAVYIFALSQAAGERAPAGPGAVLKVGRLDPTADLASTLSTTRCRPVHRLPRA